MVLFFSKFKIYYALLLALLVTFSMGNGVYAQTTAVSGKVTETNGTGLPGVSVKVKGTLTSTATDANGNYTLAGVSSNATLVFTYIGYATREIPFDGKGAVDVILSQSSNSLDEVVVTGFGQARRRGDITGSIGRVSAEQIEKSTSLTPEMALQGQVAGVQVQSAGSDPTARPTVRIRGVSTFGVADPLYVIDGVPIVEGGAGVNVDAVNGGTLRGEVNIYTLINPNDIESMSVLKDAAATAIYGVRGANGVILITTKRGKKGGVRIDFDVKMGSMKIPKTYDVLSTKQYVDFYTKTYNANPELVNGVQTSMYNFKFFGPIYNPASPQYIGNNPTTNWAHEVMNKSAAIRDYNLRASGGTEAISYNFSAGFSDNDGPLKGNFAKRYNVSSRVISQVNKYVEAGLNIRLVNENSQAGLNSWGPTSTYEGTPFQTLYDPKGPFGYAGLYNFTGPITNNTDFSSDITKKFGPEFTDYSNPLGRLASQDYKTNHQTVVGDIYVQVQPVTGLKLKASYSGQNLAIKNNNFTNENSWQFETTPQNPYGGVRDYHPGVAYHRLQLGTSSTVNTMKSLNASYLKTIGGKHNFDLLFDASEQVFSWDGLEANSYVNYTNEMLRNFGTGNDHGGGGIRTKYGLIGYLGRLAYNFDNKYYIEGLVRRDGSSRFASEKFGAKRNWGTFPAVSAGWRISRESFMKNVAFINDLKFRGSYGILGNEQTTSGWRYLSLGAASSPHYNLGSPNVSNTGVAFVSLANLDLSWEKKHALNIGFDAALLQNSISLTVEYFNNVTKGIIQPQDFNPSFGIRDAADVNIADVLNRGLEFTVGYNKKFGEFGFNASANLTSLHNEVLKLANNNAPNRFIGREVGQPLGYIYGFKEGGIFQTDAEAAAYFAKTQMSGVREKKAGDIWYQDLNSRPAAGSNDVVKKADGILDDNDRVILGNTIPKFVYGFNLGSSYKNFDLGVFFQGVGDVQRYNYDRASGENGSGYGRNRFTAVLNSWTPQNTSATLPRAVYGDPGDSHRFSDRYVENAGFLRLQNLTLGYTLPKSLMAKTRALQNLRLYATGINLFTITKYTGLDPESTPSSDTQNNQFGGRLGYNTRQFLMGLRASF